MLCGIKSNSKKVKRHFWGKKVKRHFWGKKVERNFWGKKVERNFGKGRKGIKKLEGQKEVGESMSKGNKVESHSWELNRIGKRSKGAFVKGRNEIRSKGNSAMP